MSRSFSMLLLFGILHSFLSKNALQGRISTKFFVVSQAHQFNIAFMLFRVYYLLPLNPHIRSCFVMCVDVNNAIASLAYGLFARQILPFETFLVIVSPSFFSMHWHSDAGRQRILRYCGAWGGDRFFKITAAPSQICQSDNFTATVRDSPLYNALYV